MRLEGVIVKCDLSKMFVQVKRPMREDAVCGLLSRYKLSSTFEINYLSLSVLRAAQRVAGLQDDVIWLQVPVPLYKTLGM